MSEKNNLPEITAKELSKVENNMLNEKQLAFLLAKTPKNHIYKRPGKGGGTWDYVTGTYMKKVLNLMFGWDWSFEVVEHKFDIQLKQAYVLGKLTVNSNGKSIVKMQFGRVEIKFKTEPAFNSDGTPKMAKTKDGKPYQLKETTDQPLDLGNDLKAATTDALKKCASELGIASDVYAPMEYKEIKIISEDEKIDPEEERIKSFLENADTQDDLDFIRPQINDEWLPMFKDAQKRVNKKNPINNLKT